MGKVCGATSAGLTEDHSCTLLNTNIARFDGVAEAEGDGRGFTEDPVDQAVSGNVAKEHRLHPRRSKVPFPEIS